MPGRTRGRGCTGSRLRLIGRHRRDELRLFRALARSEPALISDGGYESVDERVTALAQRRALAHALAELPGGSRDVLLLVAWAELSYEETAEALAIPVGNGSLSPQPRSMPSTPCP